MHSLIATQSAYTAIFYIALIVWGASQLYANRYRYALPGAEKRDHRSYWFLAAMVAAGIVVALVCVKFLPGATFPAGQPALFWIGIALMATGIALRGYVIRVMARYFAPVAEDRPRREVIENGPFRRVRHPNYTGVLITVLGFGLATTNWLALVIAFGCSALGYRYRVHVEEQALCAVLGDAYRDYMRRTRRFVPFLW